MRQEFDGTIVEHADLSALAPWHLNDMLVDGDGRAWVGNFGFDLMAGDPSTTTVLIQVEADGTAGVVADGLAFPNGMAAHARWHHAHRRRIVEQPAQRIRPRRRQAR